MRVKVKLTLPKPEPPFPEPPSSELPRSSFWNTYSRLSGVPGTFIEPYAAENIIRSSFAEQLSGLLNRDLSQAYSERRQASRFMPLRRPPPHVEVKLIGLRYASLELFLNILGIDSDFARQTVLSALEFYAPIALNNTVGGTAPLEAEVVYPGESVPKERDVTKLLQASLLVPVVLVLGICYVAFTAIGDEWKGLRQERETLLADRAKIIASIFDNNARILEANTKLSGELLQAAKSAASDSKATETLNAQIMTARARALGLLAPPNVPAPTPPGATSKANEDR
jgi:hypothetical protein